MERYEKYKDSGIEWIGEIPEHWDVKRLKYCADANPSNIDKKSKENEDEILLCNYVDVYKNDYISGKLDFMKATASKDQISKFILEKGDVILTKDSESANDIGIPALVAESFDNVVCGYHLTHIKPKKIKGEYLFRQFQCSFQQSYFEVSANGVTRYGLGTDKFNSAIILVPSSEEQSNIAIYLDHKTTEIDYIIANKQKLITLYEEEKQAIINQAVTKGLDFNVKFKDSEIEWLGEIPEHWTLKKIGYCSTIVRGGSPRPSGDPRYFCGDYMPWITVKEVTNAVGKFIVSTDEYLTEEGSKLSRIILPETLLLSNSGATLGVPKISKIKGCINDGSVAFTSFRDCLLRDYLYHYFVSHTNIYREEMKGNGQPNLNTEIIKSTLIPVPPIEEQLQIIDYIETECKQFDVIIEKFRNQVILLQEYRTTLISEVVTGKIKLLNTIEA